MSNNFHVLGHLWRISRRICKCFGECYRLPWRCNWWPIRLVRDWYPITSFNFSILLKFILFAINY